MAEFYQTYQIKVVEVIDGDFPVAILAIYLQDFPWSWRLTDGKIPPYGDFGDISGYFGDLSLGPSSNVSKLDSIWS